MPSVLKVILRDPRRDTPRRIWCVFIVTLVIYGLLVSAFAYSPQQDHYGSIAMKGDGSWYASYVLGEQQIQDADIFYHGIGQSIANARQADIVFLGTSRALFALDWRIFEAFAAKHHIKMFNMAFAGIMDGGFSLMLARNWDLRPRLWVIDLYPGPPNNFTTSFFNTDPGRRSSFVSATLAKSGLTARGNVIVRNLRWRAKLMFGGEAPVAYRSSKTGNWDLDNFPYRLLKDLPKIEEDGSGDCHIQQQEIDAARTFIGDLGGSTILTQGPGKYSCIQRAQELATALGTPLFAPNSRGYSSIDGGGHLDGISATRFSTEFFNWLERIPEFHTMTARDGHWRGG
jgi:hypothetical protein